MNTWKADARRYVQRADHLREGAAGLCRLAREDAENVYWRRHHLKPCKGWYSDVTAANVYVPRFKSLVDPWAYLPQQVFNCDETGLFSNKMLNMTYITAEEKALLTQVAISRSNLCSSTTESGDICRIIFYHSKPFWWWTTPQLIIQASKIQVSAAQHHSTPPSHGSAGHLEL